MSCAFIVFTKVLATGGDGDNMFFQFDTCLFFRKFL